VNIHHEFTPPDYIADWDPKGETMNLAHLHLMLTHLPVIGTPAVAALLLWALIRGSRELLRTAVGAAVIVAAISYPVFLTGEPAEDQVENATWYQERMVHDHEERAEVALIAVLVTGLVAAVTLWQSRAGRDVPKATARLTLAGLAVSSALFGWAALAGGVIRHDEVRDGAVAATPGDSTAQVGEAKRDRDKDD
jgi:hypothetical protein